MLLAIAFNIAFFFLPLYSHALTDPSGWISTGLTVAIGLSLIITAYSIFLYTDRQNQIRWLKRAMIFQVIALAMCFAVFLTLGSYGMHLWDEAIGVALLFLSLVFQYLSIRYIRSDDRLVRSMDRIR